MEKMIVKVGSGQLDRLMNISQAKRWGEKNMPADLRRAGFKVDVLTSNPELHGGLWLRVSYAK